VPQIGKDYITMRTTSQKTRLKTLVSLAVLAAVLIIATIAQFTRPQPANAYKGAIPARKEARAVFGERAPIERSVPESTRTRIEPLPQPDAAAPVAGVNDLLERWRETVMRGDVNAHTILYAPRMDQFFRRRNVTRETVHREKTRMMELYPEVNRYDISDVKVESSKPGEAVVSFRKDWDMRGDRPFSGAERQRLKLRRISGDWKIVSEEELKVYWVKRS